MSLTLDEYRRKLVNKLLLASNQDDVKRLIDAGVEGLIKNGVNGHIVFRFVEKALNELEQFSPMNKEAQQWSNIKIARIYLNRIKRHLSEALI